MDLIIGLLSKYGIIGVLIAAFLEPIIFPPPVEIILLPVLLANQSSAVAISIATVVTSFIGGVFGYYCGKAAGRPMIIKIFGEGRIKTVEKIYNRYGIFAVITSAFTPVPYEVYTLTAGAFKMKFSHYLIATFTSRVLRYVPEGILVQLFGKAASVRTASSILWFSISVTAVVIIYMILKRKVEKKRKQEISDEP